VYVSEVVDRCTSLCCRLLYLLVDAHGRLGTSGIARRGGGPL
jgi:hypothetical protein